MKPAVVVCLLLFLSILNAQPSAPVVGPRAIVNAFTLEPSPSTVAQGAIVWINGLNLGPAAGVKAEGSPLPTSLGDPPVQVLVNNVAAPIISAEPGRIVAQIPWETPPGIAQIVVRRGEASSRPSRIQVQAAWPSLRSANSLGYGEAALVANSTASIALAATGLGRTEPRAVTGEAGPADAQPLAPIRAYIGGLQAKVAANLSSGRPGEFDVNIELPPGAEPGDIITVAANRPANRLTFGTLKAPTVTFLPLPDGPAITGMTASDLRGGYAILNSARDADGCYPSLLVDIPNRTSARIDACLTAAARNAPSPTIAAVEGGALAALVGPPAGDPQNGVSSSVAVFNPGASMMKVELPGPAATLASAPGGFIALLPGTPPKALAIEPQTGNLVEVEGAPIIGANPNVGNAIILNNLKVDLGGGLDNILSLANGPQGPTVVVADDPDQPTAAKVAQLNQRGEVTGTRDFPAGWLPLLAAKAPTPTGPGGVQPPGGAPIVRPRGTSFFDGGTRALYVLARSGDSTRDAILVFGPADTSVVPLPDGWFVTTCAAAVPVQQLTLTRRFALFASKTAEKDFNPTCLALGFMLFEYGSQSASVVTLPGDGQIVAGAANNEINDYLYGFNADASRRNLSDTLFVLDGVTSTTFRLDLPSGVTNFTNVQPLVEISSLIALATNRAAGDAGIVLFDLDAGTSRLFPTPEGFATVQIIDVFINTRKLIARGIRPNNAGSQYLIYDLLTGDLAMPPNPEGVAFVGNVPPQQPTPGQPQQPQVQLQRSNAKANAITAVTFGADRRPSGILLLRVP